jgi:hypothetical protein
MDTYPRITIEPILPHRYCRVFEDGPPPQNLPPDTDILMEFVPGVYKTPEAAVESLKELLHPETRLWILQRLRDGEKVTFNLNDVITWD